MILVALAVPAAAGSWKEKHGHDDDDWDDAPCEVERKFKPNGEYKEKIRCDGPPWASGARMPPVIIVQEEPTLGAEELPPLPPGPQYGRLYVDERQLYCREYQTTAKIEGRQQRLYGTACLQPDGSWSFAD